MPFKPFEPFKKPDYLPSGEPSNPHSAGNYKLPELRKKIEKPEEKKNIFEKGAKKGGASRSEFKKELEKYDWTVHLDRPERLAIEKKEMTWSDYGEFISEKDVKRYQKKMKEKSYHLPSGVQDKTKARAEINEKIKLLEKRLKDKK